MVIPDSLIQQGISLNDRLFDLKGLSEFSSFGVSTLRDHIRRNGLPCFKVHGKTLVRLSEFNEWLEGYRVHHDQDIGAVVNSVIRDLKG